MPRETLLVLFGALIGLTVLALFALFSEGDEEGDDL
jgi:hypothetical protein